MSLSDRGLAAFALRAGVCALIVLSPLPMGSVPRTAVLAIQLSAALLFAIAWLRLRSAPTPPSFAPGLLPIALPGAVLLLLGILQLVPLPRGLVEVIAPETAAARQSVAALLEIPRSPWEPLSLSAPDTFDSILRLAMYGSIAFAAAFVAGSRQGVRRLAGCLVFSAAVQALYGVYQALSGTNAIFGRLNLHYPDVGSGTFVNPNHFAAFLALAIPFALAMAISTSDPKVAAGGWRGWLLRQQDPSFWTRLLGMAAFALLWAGVIASQSRSGFVAAAVASLLCAGFIVKGRGGSSRFLYGAAALSIPLLVVAMWSGPRQPAERWLEDSGQLASLNGRVPVWRTCLEQIPSHAVLGAGFGTFEAVFDRYRPPGLRWRWTHAHNEFLQVSLEAGIAGLLAAVALIVLAARYLVRRLSGPLPLYAAAALSSLGSISLMASIDFPLRIPAVALAAVLLPVLAGTAPGERLLDEGQRR